MNTIVRKSASKKVSAGKTTVKRDKSKIAFEHVAHYGITAKQRPLKPGPVPEEFTFNTPVGLSMDRHENVWVCDTGNDRVLVLDKTLTRIVQILESPAGGDVPFHMPFHVCPHPETDQIFITDMGNSRVVVMKNDGKSISLDFIFGNEESNGGAPLQDPNGITLVRSEDGDHHIFVNDEFFHTETDKMRNRCVRYDSKGNYLGEFRTLIEPDGERRDLYWPQGLSSDSKGNLYIANTGSYEILKCAADAPVSPAPEYSIAAKEPVISHGFKQPSGMGSLNIMRDVSVIGDRIFVPDHVLNEISVYGLDGKLESTLSGLMPQWNHGAEPAHSLSDQFYYNLEDKDLVNPYGMCQGEAPDIFFVGEPFTSRILKIKIIGLGLPEPEVVLLTALGARRDQSADGSETPQLNCVSSVVGLQPHRPSPKPVTAPEVPAWLKYNPFQMGYMATGKYLAGMYDMWWGDTTRQILDQSALKTLSDGTTLAMDAGNWRIAGFNGEGGQFEPTSNNLVNGFFMAGNVGMAAYHPRQPLLGQICPGTPLILTGNFNLGMISMYQVGPTGKLLNYGVPFGFFGQADGCMRGPQGIAVSDDGEVFVADSLNNRIAKWQILETGQVVFIKNFIWNATDSDAATFSPTDVALGADGRLFVTDQFNNRICVFDRDGAELWCYGVEGYWEEGAPDGEKLMLPASLAIDGDRLILNDLVNRALKLFRIEKDSLSFEGGISLFKLTVDNGGVWMPYLMDARDGMLYVADTTYNVVQIYKY